MEKLNPEDAELLPRAIVHHPIDADLARGIGDRRSLRRRTALLEWLGCPTPTGPLGRETNRNQVGAALRVGEQGDAIFGAVDSGILKKRVCVTYRQ